MAFSEQVIQQVWQKGKVVNGNDPNVWRQDDCDAWMGRQYYGNRQSQYGWEIDHINPNGGDGLANLRPLQWENNASKGDGVLTCAIVSSGTGNVKRR